MSDQFFWFATRGAGIMTWLAACASTLVGLMMSSRVLGRRPAIPWLLDLHRFLGAMSMLFLGVHLVTLWLDEFVSFGLAELLVPWVAHVPGLTRLSLALGVLAGWLLAAVQLSSLIKDRLPPNTWHTIHLTSFGVLIAGAVHGLEAGSDSDNSFLIALAVSVLTAITLVGLVRVSRYLSHRKHVYELSQRANPRGHQRASS